MSLWVLQLSDVDLAEEYIWMPVADLPDLSAVKSEGEMKKKLRELHPDMTPESLRHLAEEYLRFIRNLGKEEVVAVPCGEEVAFAEITGAAYFETGAAFPHRIPVKWLGRVARKKFGKHAEAFTERRAWLREIAQRDRKIAILDKVPGKQSKFAKWKWILAIVITIKLIAFAIHFVHREFAGI